MAYHIEKNEGVAVFSELNTGTAVEASTVDDLECAVDLDGQEPKTVKPYSKVTDVISEQSGGGLRFEDGDEFVLAYFEIDKKGRRVATFHYIPKYPGAGTSRFKTTVINGKRYDQSIKKEA